MQSSSVRRVPPSAAFRRLLAAVLVPLGAALLPHQMLAQTTFTTDSGFLSYQGNVTDAAGVGLGNTTPVNRTITFRIWKSATGFDADQLVYSEQQVATINKGEFSLLIGAGSSTSTTATGGTINIDHLGGEGSKGPTPESPTAVKIYHPAVFDGTARYLGVTVDDGTTAQDAEISPRQQLVATPYAFRARFAERVGSGTNAAITALDNGNVGIGSGATNPTSLLEVAGSLRTTGGASGTIVASGAISTTAGITAGGAVSALGSGGYVFSNQSNGGLFSPEAGIVTIRTAGVERVRVDDSGNVGFGITTPTLPLTFPGIEGDKIALWGTSSGYFGFAIGAGALRLTTNSAGSDVVFGYGPNASFVETMRVKGNGNVGIGTASPLSRLHISSPGDAEFGVQSTDASGRRWTFQSSGGTGPNLGKFQVVDRTAGAHRLVIDSSGNVGMGTDSPGARLHVDGGVRAASASGYTFSGETDGGLYSPADNTVTLKTGGTERLRVDSSGNVGIGTASPSFKLEVKGDSRIVASDTNTVTTGLSIIGEGNNNNPAQLNFDKSAATTGGFKASVGASPDRGMFFWVDGFDRINITKSGRVGIGTASPVAPLHVAGKEILASFLRKNRVQSDTQGALTETFDPKNQTTTVFGGKSTSIVAEGRIKASALDITDVQETSDARIKRISGKSVGTKDLQILLGIEVTDYHYRDVVTHGNAPRKKVIAQQLESVFPQAVSRSTEAIPDIFETSEIRDGWVVLGTDLKVGERVRLVGEAGSGVYEVSEVQADRFRTAAKPAGEKVFVYGREVEDFRSVDYTAISMLNVSATQEIKREKDAEVKELREKNAALGAQVAALRSQLTALAAQEKSRDAKLALIEKLLQSSQTVMAQPAKAATANGQE